MSNFKYVLIIVALAGMYYAKTKMDDQNKAKIEMIESFDEQPAKTEAAKK